ncbi:MAG: preprotein translocase subunit SecG [Patescibacteria group bacterium]|nr:preprotein translocase subunit SecG [Patescibacteria group bacterium]MCL5431856.1 preprotein translocase subunit SecG [Patescibacteria group bacterium]
MKNVLIILETIISILLIGSVLIQAKGTGLGSSFGGSGEFYQSRRGVEKIIFYATIGLSATFALVSVVLIVLP